MKKFIKFSIIFLMIVAAVTFTCYLFFKNLNKITENEVSVTNFAYSEEREAFNKELKNVVNIINSDGTDTRFNTVINISKNLDDAMKTLSTYFIEEDGVVSSKDVAKTAKAVDSSMSLAINMMAEIKIKAYVVEEDGSKTDNTFYNRHLGANDLYNCMSTYLTNYAKLVKLVNNEVSNVDKSVDIKFSIIEIYSDVVINTFTNLSIEENLVEIKNYNNINLINTYFVLQNSKISTVVNEYNKANLDFIKYYNQSNKQMFAEKLNDYKQTISASGTYAENEDLAMKYFKQLFGVV